MSQNSQLPFSPDEFYRAFAIAMLNWQKVERALFELLFSLFKNGNLVQAGAAYYSLDSFGGKLRLVDATAGAVLMGVRLAAWKAICKEVRNASGDRNALAHLPATVQVNDDQSLSLVLAPHIYVPPSLRRNRTTKYDAAKCERLAFHFDQLAKRIEVFRVTPGAAPVS